MKRVFGIVLLSAALAAPASAQGLREQLGQLFIFGSGDEPLFLAGTAAPDNPITIQAHSTHFIPSAAASNGTLITFVTNAISSNATNIPFSATSGGTTFSFQGGVPVQTSVSPGPIFGERAQTLGRGRILVGANVNAFHLESLRGVSLDDIVLNFTHVNADFPGCDSIFGGDCSLMGIPQLENDFINFHLSLDVDTRVTSFFVTYGLLDRVDIGVALPIVHVAMRGHSDAQVVPFGGPTVAHFFAGTPSDPVLTATRDIDGSATGLGDVAARIKVNVGRGSRSAFAVLGDVRFPTGSEDDLLGSGGYSVRGLGILSARFANFAPHANVGYLVRTDTLQTNAMLATVGFDQLMAPWATLAVDLESELQVGPSKLTLPGVVHIDKPFERTIQPTSIPDIRDDIVNASFGFKFTTQGGLILVLNSTWPLNRGGLRPNVLWTGGVEYNF